MLQPAINMGLLESQFWEMTVAEVQRYMEGYVWRLKAEAQLHYSLANLIGVSVGRLLSKEVQMPSLAESYPSLFEKELEQQKLEEEATNRAVNNFLARAQAINKAKKKTGGEQQV